MIELLIVIAVLGVLAVAVLSAINPIEQINRGKDTGSRSDAEQLIGAIDRSYTATGWYPWKISTEDTVNLSNAMHVINSSYGADVPVNRMLAALASTAAQSGELKESFITRIKTGSPSLWIYNNGNQGASTYVCFKPQSSSFQQQVWKRCAEGMPNDILGAVNTVICDNNTNSTNVYSCLP